jgi:hypothetical protein
MSWQLIGDLCHEGDGLTLKSLITALIVMFVKKNSHEDLFAISLVSAFPLLGGGWSSKMILED